MKKLIRKQATRFIKLQDGFTLVELLVVVSIIVALTAVMVPQVAKFAERGSNGAAAAELETIQTAMDAMMTDELLGSVNSVGAAAATHEWDSTNGTDLDPDANDTVYLYDSYLRGATTSYCYYWHNLGNVTQGNEVGSDGNCP